MSFEIEKPVHLEPQDERRKRRHRLAWDTAMTVSMKTKEDSVEIYDRIMAKFEEADKYGSSVFDESSETK